MWGGKDELFVDMIFLIYENDEEVRVEGVKEVYCC